MNQSNPYLRKYWSSLPKEVPPLVQMSQEQWSKFIHGGRIPTKRGYMHLVGPSVCVSPDEVCCGGPAYNVWADSPREALATIQAIFAIPDILVRHLSVGRCVTIG